MTEIPNELTFLPYQLHALSRADATQSTGPEYVTGYLTPPPVGDEGYNPSWLEVQLASVRAALPAGWTAATLATDPGDTRIVVRADSPADPLLGFSPDEIVIGPGGQLLAEEQTGMSDGDRAVAGRVSDLAEIEPAHGYEERAVERAKRDGLF